MFSFSTIATVPTALCQYECTTAGMFRYPDPTCRAFYICALYNSRFVRSNYTCPISKIFDQTTQQCSSTASCEDISTVCGSETAAEPPWPTYPNPTAVNCSSYITCYGTNPIVTSCPSGYYYNNKINSPGCFTKPDCT
ncbi:unnamed protein product [Acanthoscelides obtectus]|uniref:Chitin-binding type-2 domain-containing protein n=1 Tax=Acanthoscelides obtectus TaxID=200917 RepID=A0A9P0NY64_ACAOB|nr:unnamed protein product [Acanthoscelides obtectus]CAK1628045.1 hypothetical protein AOBTE_LOCUS4980 [Acanthoscelides obtectus]